jgi:hypothetical protein
MDFSFNPVSVGKMYPSQLEYFGEEQHTADMKEIVSNQESPLKILGKFQGDWLDDLDTATKLATKDMYTSREHHSDYLYITRILGENINALPVLSRMAGVLGFEEPTLPQVQFQRPGCLMPKHVDPPSIFKDPFRIRVLVTLAPWEYGQFMFFNNTLFQHWDAGTVIYTTFDKTWHCTMNSSWHTRPILQITGVPGPKLQQLLKNPEPQIFQL